jgi:quercetin dioxygenase-like cupin family protein
MQVVSAIAVAGVVSFFCASMADAQESGLPETTGAKRTVLEQKDLSVQGYEGVLVRTELAPGAVEPLHTHPGDFFAYVLEGTITLTRQGQETVKKKAGEVFFVPSGMAHGASNDGKTTCKLLVTFFVEKGKPLSTPIK